MKKLTECFKKSSAFGLALGMAGLLAVPVVALGADSSMMGGMMHRGDTMMNHGNQVAHHREMRRGYEHMWKVRKRIQAQLKKQDVQLRQLATRMNKATGQKKTELMARLLTKLVHDRVALNHEMARMRPRAWRAQTGPMSSNNHGMMRMNHNRSRS